MRKYGEVLLLVAVTILPFGLVYVILKEGYDFCKVDSEVRIERVRNSEITHAIIGHMAAEQIALGESLMNGTNKPPASQPQTQPTTNASDGTIQP